MTIAERLQAIVGALPDSAAVVLPVAEVRAWLVEPELPMPPPAGTWRERLWTCPADTRLGVRELCEALGRTKSWVYRAASSKMGQRRLPARRMGGELVFLAGEVRTWIEQVESVP